MSVESTYAREDVATDQDTDHAEYQNDGNGDDDHLFIVSVR